MVPMFITTRGISTFLAASALGLAQGQVEEPTFPNRQAHLSGIEAGQAAALPTPIPDWRIPLHTAADDPTGGAYGLWAAGPTYKVSFHDGFAFYPYLGASYPENLPLQWNTLEVSRGRDVLTRDGDPHVDVLSPWRFERRYAQTTEAYDVLPEGVEQTFTLAAPVGSTGDLLIRGRITTKLWAAPVSDAVGDLSFCDADGRTILTYGRALAFDACGRRIDVATSFDGETITLRLDDAWLREASYPVTIDPLTTRFPISTWGGTTYGRPSTPSVARDNEFDQLLVSYSRSSAAGDDDTYARLVEDDFTFLAFAFTDVTASWSTNHARPAFVGGANRWVLAMERYFPASSSYRVRAYVHDANDLTENSGTTIFLDPALGVNHRYPDAGGTAGYSSGNDALIVFQEEIGGPASEYSDVLGVLVDASSPSFGSTFLIESTASGTRYDRENPTVNQISDGGSASWVVAWQQYDHSITGDDFDIAGRLVHFDGTLGGRISLGPSGTSTQHKFRPVVEGRGGRYLVHFALADNAGTKPISYAGHTLAVQRFDWPEGSSATTMTHKTVASGPLEVLYPGTNVGFDNLTQSHWTVTWHTAAWDVYTARVGYTGGIVEEHVVYNTTDQGYSPAVTFNDDDREFVIVWATTQSPVTSQPIYGTRLQYPADAVNVPYGTSCSGTIYGGYPFAGSEFMQIRLVGGLPARSSALFLSLGAGSFPLGNGCSILLDLLQPIYLFYSGVTDANGNVGVTFPLPDAPIATGDVYLQWVQISPTATLVTSGGMRSQVR